MKKYICYVILKPADMVCNMPIIYESTVDLKNKSWEPIKSMVGYIDYQRLCKHKYLIDDYVMVFDDYEDAKKWFNNSLNQKINFLEKELDKLKNWKKN